MKKKRKPTFLIIGQKDKQMSDLSVRLEQLGYKVIFEQNHNKLPIKTIKNNHIDLLIVNCKNFKNVKTLSDFLINDPTLPSLPILPVVEDGDVFCLELADNLIPGLVDCIHKSDDTDVILQKITSIVKLNEEIYTDKKAEEVNVGGNLDLDAAILNTNTVKVDNVKVYLIEDDPLLQDLIVSNLKRSGFLFEINDNCDDVLTKMKTFSPQVLILDLMLPNCNGLDLLKLIREDNELKSVPVVIFSNIDSEDDRKRAEELGVSGFYVKAMTDLSELMFVLKDLAKNKESYHDVEELSLETK